MSFEFADDLPPVVIAVTPELLKAQLAELADSLEKDIPGWKHILQQVYTSLKSDADVVTIMTEEEIALVVKGLIQFSGAELVASVTKGKKTKAPAIKDLGLF